MKMETRNCKQQQTPLCFPSKFTTIWPTIFAKDLVYHPSNTLDSTLGSRMGGERTLGGKHYIFISPFTSTIFQQKRNKQIKTQMF